MNKNGVWTALALILVSVVMSFFGKVFAVGGLFGGSLQTIVIGLGMVLLSPLFLVGGVIYTVYSIFQNPADGSATYSNGDNRVFEPGDSQIYCRNCGKVILKTGKFCKYCGREQLP